MAPGSPTEDSPFASRPASGADLHPFLTGQPITPGLGDPNWRAANLVLEQRYLELGRAQIEEMCLDLKARLAARMSTGLKERLAGEPAPDAAATHTLAGMERQVETAAAVAEKLLADVSWVLPWDQAKTLVEPYAKGSWLLAQIQVMEEQRVIAIFAAQLLEQATAYMRELIERFYGVDRAPEAAASQTNEAETGVPELSPDAPPPMEPRT